MAAGEGFLLGAAEGRGGELRFLGMPLRMLATGRETGGAYTLFEREEVRGFATPLHVHRSEDEAFYVLAGEVLLAYGDEHWEAGPGAFVFLPRSVPHAFMVVSETARLLQLSNPSGLEEFAAAMADVPLAEPNIPVLEQAAARHGIEILGPPPFASA
jgi:quercetin dioxygenase-like cupin family protein